MGKFRVASGRKNPKFDELLKSQAKYISEATGLSPVSVRYKERIAIYDGRTAKIVYCIDNKHVEHIEEKMVLVFSLSPHEARDMVEGENKKYHELKYIVKNEEKSRIIETDKPPKICLNCYRVLENRDWSPYCSQFCFDEVKKRKKWLKSERKRKLEMGETKTFTLINGSTIIDADGRKKCQYCGKSFIGPSNAKYCSEHRNSRFRVLYKRKKE